jgi:hypothetical protein
MLSKKIVDSFSNFAIMLAIMIRDFFLNKHDHPHFFWGYDGQTI